MLDTVICGADVVTPAGVRRCTIAVNDGLVAGLVALDLDLEAACTIDATGRLVLPGQVALVLSDRVRDPEELAALSRAAALGGATTLAVRMPQLGAARSPHTGELLPVYQDVVLVADWDGSAGGDDGSAHRAVVAPAGCDPDAGPVDLLRAVARAGGGLILDGAPPPATLERWCALAARYGLSLGIGGWPDARATVATALATGIAAFSVVEAAKLPGADCQDVERDASAGVRTALVQRPIDVESALAGAATLARGLGEHGPAWLAGLIAAQPARALGLSSRKGAIEVGADADLVVLDVERRWRADDRPAARLTGADRVSGELTGKPILSLSRGRLLLLEDDLKLRAGAGTLLRAS